jgi:hypothetical protein
MAVYEPEELGYLDEILKNEKTAARSRGCARNEAAFYPWAMTDCDGTARHRWDCDANLGGRGINDQGSLFRISSILNMKWYISQPSPLET